MAQLVKLEDCISRYESDVFRYTGQYIRLKKERWERLKENWQQKKETHAFTRNDQPVESTEKAKKWWKKNRESDWSIEESEDHPQVPDFEEVKDQFRRELFHFQLKWASSTLHEKSRVAQSTLDDPVLKFLLMELPDNVLVFYKPVIRLKQAPTQMEVILISPDSIHCLVFLDLHKDCIITASTDRFWKIEGSKRQTKLISPVPAIQRMNYFIDSVIDPDSSNLNVHYSLVSRKGIIDAVAMPSYINQVDQRNFESWHTGLKRQPSPIKFTQLKAAKSMLERGIVTSFNRPEWEDRSDDKLHYSSD